MDAERWISAIAKRRRTMQVLLIVVTVVAAFGASRLGVDNAVDIWFPQDDPALAEYRQFLDTYGNDEVVVIAVHDSTNILSDDGLKRIGAIADVARGVDGIASVRSIVDEPIVRGDATSLYVGSVRDAAEAAQLLGKDPVVDSLVSADRTTALVLAEMAVTDEIDARRDGILLNLREAVAAMDSDVSYAGIGVVYAALNDASTRGAAGIIAASYLLILVLLRWLVGHWRPTVVVVSAVGMGAVWLMGLYGVSGRNINMVTMVMPTLVLVIGVSDCIHMLTHIAAQPSDWAPIDRVRRGIGEVFWPCAFNTITTALGFLALATASMPVVQDLGIFCAIALCAAFVGALIVCSVWGLMTPNLPRTASVEWVQRTVEAMANTAVRRPVAVVLIAAFTGLLSAWGVTRIEVDTYSIDFLYADHPTRVDSDRIEDGFGPYTPLEFVVRSGDGVRVPEVFESVRRWQREVEDGGHAAWSRSAVDAVVNLDRVLSGEAQGSVPQNSAHFEQILLLLEADGDNDMARWLAPDEMQLRVTFGVAMGSARDFEGSIQRIVDRSELPANVEVHASGYIPLYVKIMRHIVESQVSSFAVAFVVIFGLIAVLFRSFRMAALAVPANLLPVLVTLGFMGLVGIRLDVATVTISAIVLGLVVDDTIQFLYRYRAERRKSDDIETIVRGTVRTVGRPMLMTSVILAGGFSVLGFAAIKSVAYFGVLLSVALMSAFVADSLVVPALLVLTARPVNRVGD